MKKFSILLFVLALKASAQQDPLYSLYMTNVQAINPAYAGIHNTLIASVNHRSQWANLPQHPVTTSAAVHSSIFGDYVGIGVMMIQDQIGVVRNTETSLMSSYQISGNGYKLSFGLQFGMVSQQFDYSMLNLDPTASDPVLVNENGSTKLNIGSGMIFMSDKIFIGVSVPRMAQPVVSSNESVSLTNDPTVYLMGSAIFPLDVETELQPTVLVRYGNGLMSYDVGVNWVYERFFTGGLFTRDASSFGALLGIKVMKKFDLRYSFEVYSKNSDGFENYANEISIRMNMAVFDFQDVLSSTF